VFLYQFFCARVLGGTQLGLLITSSSFLTGILMGACATIMLQRLVKTLVVVVSISWLRIYAALRTNLGNRDGLATND
jgi:hypothetical protein